MTPGMEVAHLRRELEYTRQRVSELTREQTPAERNALAETLSRFDAVAALRGERASAPLPGERPVEYKRRLLESFKRHSTRFSNTDLARLDASAVDPIVHEVLQDAETSARRGDGIREGTIVPVTSTENGRQVTRFLGDPLGWMAPFMLGGAVATIARPAA